VRIGVLADTHVGEHLPALPPEVLERFDGVDLIVHAGDVAVPRVLEELAEGAPVAAVRGNHDRGPLRREITQDEVADTAVYLASPLSASVTGETIFVDAGFHAMGL
jgi:putative phosphoesterase